MLKKAYDQGAQESLARFGLKEAGMLDTVKSFGQGQLGHLGSMVHGARGMLGYDPTGQALGKGIFMHGLRGAAPTLAGAGALGMMALSGDDPQQQPRR